MKEDGDFWPCRRTIQRLLLFLDGKKENKDKSPLPQKQTRRLLNSKSPKRFFRKSQTAIAADSQTLSAYGLTFAF